MNHSPAHHSHEQGPKQPNYLLRRTLALAALIGTLLGGGYKAMEATTPRVIATATVATDEAAAHSPVRVAELVCGAAETLAEQQSVEFRKSICMTDIADTVFKPGDSVKVTLNHTPISFGKDNGSIIFGETYFSTETISRADA